MKLTIAITKQWQIHIPRRVRDELGMTAPSAVDIEAKDGKIIISSPTASVLNDAGKYAGYASKKKIDLDTIRDNIDYSDL